MEATRHLVQKARAQTGRRVCCAASKKSANVSGSNVSKISTLRRGLGRQELGRAGKVAKVGSPREQCSVRSLAAKDSSSGTAKLLTKAEIPAFIPREDFIQQLYQWAEISMGQRGRAVYGYSMVVEQVVRNDTLKGFSVQIGDETTIEVGMDDEITEKYEFLSRGKDGFPVPKGKVEEIKGKYLEVRKMDTNEVSENAKQAIRELISQVMKAFDSYYAFGSVFSHDST